MQIPELTATRLNQVFVEGDIFGAIDSNLKAWLQQDWDKTSTIEIIPTTLKQHRDNRELIDDLGGEKEILKHTIQPQQIRYLAENNALQKNGLSNLFFVYSDKENNIFIVGVVWDKSINKFVPYIYRTRNLYRAWTRGNQIFLKK